THPDTDNDEVALDRITRTRAHTLDRARTLEPLHPAPEPHTHAVIDVDVAIERAELGAEHTLKRNRIGRDHRDPQPTHARRRRNLAADPPRPDHHHRPAPLKPLTQHVTVSHATQVV